MLGTGACAVNARRTLDIELNEEVTQIERDERASSIIPRPAAMEELMHLGACSNSLTVKDLEASRSGIRFESEADETTTGPASFIVVDPDGNPVLVDQHV
jgi:hypothetical protein